jgi:hypothetical protein
MKNLFSILIAITLVGGLFWGCKKKGDPPVLPPSETMLIDFSEFVIPSKSSIIESNVRSVENSNWDLASSVAGLWNIILAAKLAVPVAAFQHAVDNQPVYLDNKKWEWSYSVSAIGSTYKARLTGQIRDTDIKWEMYIAKEGVGAFTEFLWFEGTTEPDGKSGQWILNHSQILKVPMLQIDWTLNGTSVGSIKYTYIMELNESGDPETFKGSYIEYGLTTNTLNAYYTVHLNITGIENDFEDVFIEWSTSAHNGRIKSGYFFQDELWHCWDGSGNNVDCT